MSIAPAERAVRRVAVIAYHSSPLEEPGSGDAGGMSVYVTQLARALVEKGISTDIFTRASRLTPRLVDYSEGVRVISIEAGPPGIDKERAPKYLGRFVDGVRAFSMGQRLAYDVVHSHYWQSGVAASRLRTSWNVPHVHSNHTLGLVKNAHLPPGEEPEPAARIDGERRVIGGCDVLVASTDKEVEQLAFLYAADRDRMKTIHPGVDHDLFFPGPRDDARAELGLAEDTSVVLCVGRIQALKGIDLAIRALARIEPRPLLLIVGGPSGAAGDRELARLRDVARAEGVEQDVRFEGPQPHGTLPTYYRAADVVAISSYSESFGFAALEAHACGTPVVATSVGGLSHVVRDGLSGYIVDDRNLGAFADRLQAVLRDPARAHAFGRAAHEVAGNFSWDRAARSFAELYGCLAEERAPEVCVC